MERFPKSTMAIDAIDSSVNSLAASFGQLEMNPITGGPINLLPNEIMQLIMAKLKLDGDVKKLIRLRLVSTRWRAVVEDYCRLKKTLGVILDQHNTSTSSHHYRRTLKKRFFGLTILKESASLLLSPKTPSQCLISLLSLFPNIVQLSIRCKGDSRIGDFIVYANSLDSLKHLDLSAPFVPALTSLSTALSKLDYFSINSFGELKYGERSQLVAHLGPSCVRVYFGIDLTHRQIVQWHRLNPLWLTNLTHLQLRIRRVVVAEESDQVVHFIGEHATSLKYLNLNTLSFPLEMTPTLMHDFAKLTHLEKLEIPSIGINLSNLEQIALQHTPLSSVLTCDLRFNWLGPIGADQLMRVMSVLLPSLVDLKFYIQHCFGFTQNDVEQHLYRSTNLRKHKIIFY